MKRKYIAVLFILILFLGSCFKVERDNPYDPDSNLPYGEKYLTVEGYVFRGTSEEGLANVEINLEDHWAFTDSNGYYKIPAKPGTYTITAYKSGWLKESREIVVSDSKNSSQHENFSLFIWNEYFDSYQTYNPPPANDPWSSQIILNNGSSQYQILDSDPTNFLQMIIQANNDSDADAKFWLHHIPVQDYTNPQIIKSRILFRTPTLETEYVYSIYLSGGNSIDIFIRDSSLFIGKNDTPAIDTSQVFTSFWGEPLIITTYVDSANEKADIYFWQSGNENPVLGSPYFLEISGWDYEFVSVQYWTRYKTGAATFNLDGEISLFAVELF